MKHSSCHSSTKINPLMVQQVMLLLHLPGAACQLQRHPLRSLLTKGYRRREYPAGQHDLSPLQKAHRHMELLLPSQDLSQPLAEFARCKSCPPIQSTSYAAGSLFLVDCSHSILFKKRFLASRLLTSAAWAACSRSLSVTK